MQSRNDYKTVRWNVPLQPLVSFWTCAGSEGNKSVSLALAWPTCFAVQDYILSYPLRSRGAVAVTLLTELFPSFLWFFVKWFGLLPLHHISVNRQSTWRQTIHTASTRKQRTCSWKFSSICSISSSMSVLLGKALTSFIVSLRIFLKCSEIGNGLLKSMALICGEVRFKQLH